MPASLGKMGGSLAETKDEEYEALATQVNELESVSFAVCCLDCILIRQPVPICPHFVFHPYAHVCYSWLRSCGMIQKSSRTPWP